MYFLTHNCNLYDQHTDKMEVQHEDNGKKGGFFILHECERAAAMTYTWAGTDRIHIDHTEVSDA
jgi:uncharacterized protein